jgi:hypothetical protein
MSLAIAFRAFFATLFDKTVAQRVRLALSPTESNLTLEQMGSPTSKISIEKTTAVFPEVNVQLFSQETLQQSAAITLLATLQREARFIDFIQESLAGFSDAQIGAAARTVHDDCAKVLQRFFDLQPIVNQPEESPLEITEGNASSFQLTGNLSQSFPCQGKLIHSGWKATKIDLPTWSGQPETALIVAPSEVEI